MLWACRRSVAGPVTLCSQARHIDLISLPEQPDCKRPLVAAAISLFNLTPAVWKDRRSVSQGDEREGNGSGLSRSPSQARTDQIDTQIGREMGRGGVREREKERAAGTLNSCYRL